MQTPFIQEIRDCSIRRSKTGVRSVCGKQIIYFCSLKYGDEVTVFFLPVLKVIGNHLTLERVNSIVRQFVFTTGYKKLHHHQ
jgi:hypothetical protein